MVVVAGVMAVAAFETNGGSLKKKYRTTGKAATLYYDSYLAEMFGTTCGFSSTSIHQHSHSERSMNVLSVSCTTSSSCS